MLVVDLHCALGHDFEGWFGSADDLADQQARGLVTCPICGGHEVVRRPSAPRLNVSGLKEEGQVTPVSAPAASASGGGGLSSEGARHAETAQDVARALRSMYADLVREVTARTEDVGERFAEEARRIHHGEAPERGIRGQASAEEREALADEGIEVMALPWPVVPKSSLQ
ncbi:DUF1178 domain-containing protein [Aquabacterium olei]|uniref:DUF1178 domain-containing protein n=1 Tax=Aquabacterium olei TaxID=1296669 RepID=A0A2U8FSD6_9BURK|nr:DUF1178 family protein [Aquabacterium olei]AWI53920.1 DUF1178 domain-containing protein [Aquabacterium olei]